MLKLSANLGFLWNDRPHEERVHAAAVAGFRGVEFHWPYDTPAAALRQACDRHRLSVIGVNTGVGDTASGEFGLGAIPGAEHRFREDLRRVIDYASAIQAAKIHVLAGVVEKEQQASARDTYLENLAFAATQCAEHGLGVLIEPMNQRSRPGYFLTSSDAAAEIIDLVASPQVSMLFDVFHIAVAEGDVSVRMAKYADKIGHVQIASVPARAEPDSGEIDYRYVLGKLEALGYSGWVGCEYLPATTPEAGLSWVDRLGLNLAGDSV